MSAPAPRLQALATDAYRRNPYPTAVHTPNHPDRLATFATLAGMTPPDVRTARVLEVGVGNGMNLLALAQALPHAQFTGFDIEGDAIAVGREWAEEAGLRNVRLDTLDLLDAADALDGEYDYVIAHGVYAWVPPAVGDALMALIGRVLAPHGVAMVSFNALPGGHARIAIREIMLNASVGAASDVERLANSRAALRRVAEPRAGDTAEQAGFRATARETLSKADAVLIHDELGETYRPQSLRAVLREAAANGLAFLGDTTLEHLDETFFADGVTDQAAIDARACARDEADFALFRRLLLMRADMTPRRAPTPSILEALYVSSRAEEPEPGVFNVGARRVKLDHPRVQAALRLLASAWPARVRVRDLGLAAGLLPALLRLFDNNLVTLHTIDAPYAVAPGRNPVASPLARMMVRHEMPWLASLLHQEVEVSESAARVMLTFDGNPDAGRFAAATAGQDMTRDDALTFLARNGFLISDEDQGR